MSTRPSLVAAALFSILVGTGSLQFLQHCAYLHSFSNLLYDIITGTTHARPLALAGFAHV
jgi:hypothetical protein